MVSGQGADGWCGGFIMLGFVKWGIYSEAGKTEEEEGATEARTGEA